MISQTVQNRLASAFAKAQQTYGDSYSILGVSFEAVKGAHGRSMRGDEEMIQGLDAEVSDASHMFWISALRYDFPAALMDGRQIKFDQGVYATCSTDGRDYMVEQIINDTSSPWLRFQLRAL